MPVVLQVNSKSELNGTIYVNCVKKTLYIAAQD
jgi:hypothetical protein